MLMVLKSPMLSWENAMPAPIRLPNTLNGLSASPVNVTGAFGMPTHCILAPAVIFIESLLPAAAGL